MLQRILRVSGEIFLHGSKASQQSWVRSQRPPTQWSRLTNIKNSSKNLEERLKGALWSAKNGLKVVLSYRPDFGHQPFSFLHICGYAWPWGHWESSVVLTTEAEVRNELAQHGVISSLALRRVARQVWTVLWWTVCPFCPDGPYQLSWQELLSWELLK